MSLTDDLRLIGEQAQEMIAGVASLEELDAIRVAVMGKKGSLTAAMKGMGKLAPEERPQVGKLANEVRARVEAELEARKAELSAIAMQARFAKDAVDVTLPGRGLSLGTQHLISQIREEIEDIFCGLGYIVADGPYVETKEHLGGFCVVDVSDDETARCWAGRLAAVLDWPQEVHRFRGPGEERRRHAPDT